MRCHIECNEEVLCILVNSCAKHVRVFLQEHSPDLQVSPPRLTNVPAGTFDISDDQPDNAACVPEATPQIGESRAGL